MPETRVKSINKIAVYIVRGEDGGRNLLVDTGINQDSCFNPIMSAFRELGIKAEDTDVFITHLHSDHSGLAARLKNPSNRVMAEEREAKIINSMQDEAYWKLIYGKYREEGLPMDYSDYRASHPDGENYPDVPVEFEYMHEGDILEYGGYSFRCVLMPGHSPAHTCLYDEKSKTMIAGDVVLSDVVPVLFFEPDFDDPLNAYLESLDRICGMEIDNFLPMHGSDGFDMKARSGEIIEYYKEQFEWINKQLEEKGRMNAWQIADLMMQRDFKRSIETVSAVSRWFFFLPASVCVRYMGRKGLLNVVKDAAGVNYYSSVPE